MEKLSFHLSFHFDNEESQNILNDYEEWFANEALQGKSDEEICLALGSPKKVTTNLLLESGKQSRRVCILLRNIVIQSFLIVILHCLFSVLLLQNFNRSASSYLYAGLSMIFIYFIIGSVLTKKTLSLREYDCRVDFNKSNLLIFGLVIMIMLFELLFLPKMKGPRSGITCFWILSILMLSILLANIYFVKKIFQAKQLIFLITFHILGVVTLLFYIINQLNMLYDSILQYSNLIQGSLGIYIETIVLCLILYKKANIRWTLN